MDQKKIDALKEKRKLLQEELRLKEKRKGISSLIAFSEKHGYPFKFYYDFENAYWVCDNIQVRKRDGYHGIYNDFQVDVDDNIPNEDILYAESNAQLETHLKALFSALLPKDCSIVVFYQGTEVEIEVSLEALLKKPLLFFDRLENWILAKNDGWIIEYIWEQQVVRFIQYEDMKPILRKKIIVQ